MSSLDSQYDYDSTIFSPDGRFFQIEYIRENEIQVSTKKEIKYKLI